MENFLQSPSCSPWDFYNPVRVYFGSECRSVLGSKLAGLKVLVVTTLRGREQFVKDPILSNINAEFVWVTSVTSNPSLAQIQFEIDRLAGNSYDAVLAFGGGSAIDAAKALAAALTPGQRSRDLATLIASPELHLTRPILNIYAVTTTSGTGSEVTPFATIWDHDNRKKLSLTSDKLFPTAAIVDPELTYTLPRAETLSTGLDALNQAFESVWNHNRTSVSTLLAARAIGLALKAIPKLAANIENQEARNWLSEASVLSGLCISQTRTAICHSISYPLTAHFGIAHGLACAFTMGAVADLVLKNSPLGLAEVAVLNNLPTPNALVEKLNDVLSASNLSAECHARLPSVEALLGLRAEMHTKGRADNFVLEINDKLLYDVLTKS